MYKFILLDADNTLLDFDSAQLSSFMVVLDHFGINYSNSIYTNYININHSLWHAFEQGKIGAHYVQTERFCALFRDLGHNINGIDANKIYQEALEVQCQLMPYAEEVCRKLSSFSTLSIVTNGVGSTQKARIAKSKIAKYISLVVVSEDIGFQKPSIKFFDEVFIKLKNPKLNEVLIVGDSLSSDIQGGINAGIHTCYYTPSGISIDENIKPNYIISDLRELISITQQSK